MSRPNARPCDSWRSYCNLKTDEILARLADVELPTAPDWTPTWYALAGVVVFAALTFAFFLRRRHVREERRATPAPGAEARARVDALHDAWSRGEIAPRTAAYRLATVLRLALGLRQLDAHAPPSGIEAREWAVTLERLRALRYGRHPVALETELFTRIASWIARHDTATCMS